MSTTELKLELAKKLLNTTDKDLINHIKAVFSTQTENWFNELPEEIKLSVKKGLKESAEGKTIPHEQVMKRFKK